MNSPQSADKPLEVLILEDNPSTQLRITVSFDHYERDHPGFRRVNTTVFGDGSHALHRIQAGYQPDVVVCDYSLPELTGLEWMARAKPWLNGTRLIVLTTKNQRAIRREAKKLGMALSETGILYRYKRTDAIRRLPEYVAHHAPAPAQTATF
jgi:CheY-like chemotaxis protein